MKYFLFGNILILIYFVCVKSFKNTCLNVYEYDIIIINDYYKPMPNGSSPTMSPTTAF
ncbi:MAG: hypothetical protein GX346_05885 [Clostridiales bacterium]|nr:hypothetical protein [Clostridiales bacterium]